MSALRVSRRAAEESSLIAVLQSLAAMAAFPAAYSGSSCPSFVSSDGSPKVAPGKRARPRLSMPTAILTPITPLLTRQTLLQLAKLWPVAIAVPRKLGELLEVVTRLLCVTGGLRGLGRAVESAQSHRRVLQRGLVLLQGRGRLTLRHQHVSEQLAHRVEPVLHGDVLFAGVLKVGGRPHELEGVGLVALALGRPRLGGECLDLDLAGPITLARLLERRSLLLQLVDVGARRGDVAAAGAAHGAREVRDRLGHREARVERFQLRSAL